MGSRPRRPGDQHEPRRHQRLEDAVRRRLLGGVARRRRGRCRRQRQQLGRALPCGLRRGDRRLRDDLERHARVVLRHGLAERLRLGSGRPGLLDVQGQLVRHVVRDVDGHALRERARRAPPRRAARSIRRRREAGAGDDVRPRRGRLRQRSVRDLRLVHLEPVVRLRTDQCVSRAVAERAAAGLRPDPDARQRIHAARRRRRHRRRGLRLQRLLGQRVALGERAAGWDDRAVRALERERAG